MDFGDLEMLVMYDMYTLGYDPANPEDIKNFWETMLNDN